MSGGKVEDRELHALMAAFLENSRRYRLRRITIVPCEPSGSWLAQASAIGSEAIGFIQSIHAEGLPARMLLQQGHNDPRAFIAGDIPVEFFSFRLFGASSAQFELRLKRRPSKEQAELISRTFSDRMARLGPKELRRWRRGCLPNLPVLWSNRPK